MTRQSANPFRAERLGGFIPFIWYGMRFGDWWKLLASGEFGVTLNRLPNALGVTAMAPVSSIMHVLTEAVYRRAAEAIRIEPPVFVLGHWRTGTTLLHNLLACDPAAAFPTTFECTFPGRSLLTRHITGRLIWLFLPKNRPMDDVPVGGDLPFEDEFALAKMGLGTPYRDLAFPRRGAANIRYLDLADLSAEERRKWEETFLWLMQRFQLSHPGKRLVLKSPPHTARIATLLKLFPEARFVHIARNPFDVYPSTYRLWKVLNSRLGLTNPALDDELLPEQILSTLPRMYAAYERDREAVPPGRLVEVRYEELVANPKATLARIYSDLGLGDFAPVVPRMESFLGSVGGHKARQHNLSDIDRRAVAGRWSAYFERFGYRDFLSGVP